MKTCDKHPDRRADYTCMKYDAHMCEQCLKCKDPELYCKYRSSCAVWFLTKKKFKD
jgi:hypothetical protein